MTDPAPPAIRPADPRFSSGPTAESVIVFIDLEKGGSTPIPEDIREVLETYTTGGG